MLTGIPRRSMNHFPHILQSQIKKVFFLFLFAIKPSFEDPSGSSESLLSKFSTACLFVITPFDHTVYLGLSWLPLCPPCSRIIFAGQKLGRARRRSLCRGVARFKEWIILPSCCCRWWMNNLPSIHYSFKCPTYENLEDKLNITRSSWLNCALRDDEAVYWVSIGHYVAVAVGNWWYWVSRGHSCLYILHKVEIWAGVTHALRTDSLTDFKR